MSIEVRLAAIAMVLFLSQSCHRTDADPVNAQSNDERLNGVIKETITPKSAAHKPLPAGVEERLRRLIKETVTPIPAVHKPLPADVAALLAWSKPVNGLVARVDDIADIANLAAGLCVRLKNVSDHPLTVPTGNTTGETGVALFDVYVRQGSSAWRQITSASRYDRYFGEPDDYKRGLEPRTDRPWVTLQAGEDCTILVGGVYSKGTGEPRTSKVILRLPKADEKGRWSGVLETPSRPMQLTQGQRRALRGAVPFPFYFPRLSYDYSGVVNGGGGSEVELLYGPNWWLIDRLAIYEPAGVRTEFERRMRAEKVVPMKLLLASIAAAAGSEEAALLFLKTMRETDYPTIHNLHYALWLTSLSYLGRGPDWQKKELPDWLVELCLAVLSDDRLVRSEEPNPPTVASQASYVLRVMEHSKIRRAVPLLIERVKNDGTRRGIPYWQAVVALGKIGDERAIPVVVELLKAAVKKDQFAGEEQLHWDLTSYADVLADLKARDAVPILLTYVDYPEIIRDLAEIGDERTLPALRKIIAARGRVLRDGKPVSPALESERLFAAKMALARLEPKNEAQRLVEMAADSNRDQRYWVVLRLGQISDPRVIPALVKVIETDSDHYIIDLAIQGLSGRKEKAAIEGLIDCFDVAFKEQRLGKGKREHVTPASYRNLIARNLQEITGQSFGADKCQWLKWWLETGRKNAEFR